MMRRRRRTARDEQLLKNFKTWCVICRRKIPRKRHRRHAITCSDVHQKRLTRLRKMERDRRICQQCGRSCTERQRTELREFRLWKRSKAQGHAKKGAIAKKGILRPARGIHALSKFAHICPKRTAKVRRGGKRKAA